MRPEPLLRPGDIVDVVAPGFRCSPESLRRGVEFVRRLGLEPRVPRRLFGADLLCANSDRRRLEQLRRSLAAPDSRCVWCVRAGYGAIRLIEPLMRSRPPRRRKLFIGYSDATTLHYLLNQHWGWPSLHGPLLDRLGSGRVRGEELAELEAVLFGRQTETRFTGLVPLNAAARARRTLRATMFGGNLTVFETIVGTALERRPRGFLFLEDVGERGYRIDRMLEHLRQAGVFRGVRAIIFGSFVGGNEPDGRSLVSQVLRRFAAGQTIPVLTGIDAGHGEYQRPVFFGTRAELVLGAAPRLAIETARP